mgnify:CR=1|jgi:hypothetical protein
MSKGSDKRLKTALNSLFIMARSHYCNGYVAGFLNLPIFGVMGSFINYVQKKVLSEVSDSAHTAVGMF